MQQILYVDSYALNKSVFICTCTW